MQNARLIDYDHLEKYVSGDDALRDEILGIFAEQVELLLGKIDVDLSDDDWKDAVHALKGAARGVGAWALGDICEEAEMLVGPAPANQEARSSLLVSLRHLAQSAISESKTTLTDATG